jgi:hypothetical protein
MKEGMKRRMKEGMKRSRKEGMTETLTENVNKDGNRWCSAWWLRRMNEQCAVDPQPQPTLAFECTGGILFAHLLLPLPLPLLGETLLFLALLFSLLFLLCSVLQRAELEWRRATRTKTTKKEVSAEWSKWVHHFSHALPRWRSSRRTRAGSFD